MQIKNVGISMAIAAIAVIASISKASALTWDWSFNSGAETGTFQTSGTYADTANSYNFTIDDSTFTDTSSAFAPSIVGTSFTDVDPNSGFLWSGTSATEFYRNSPSSTLTNGSDYGSSGYEIVFYSNGAQEAELQNEGAGTNDSFTTLTLTPLASSPVNLTLFAPPTLTVPFEFSSNLAVGILGVCCIGKLLIGKAKAVKNRFSNLEIS